ncbi:hypothetical protein KUTeg_008687 [Tegillarca granosa]|uniref:pyridoxal 5'-phosphate synthase n=1 Tax=Tegillarca granosa TaxID=220873 RepID=A0ABQ9FD19_TEGGR|nr:hypothetical protein KUTeg_008687 [Tegillarca granosa]
MASFVLSQFKTACVRLRLPFIHLRCRMADVADMRTPYRSSSDTFDVEDLVSRNPFKQFESWFDEACHTPDIVEANAMALATSTKNGLPAVRMVLLKGFDMQGFKFFTNYESRKSSELQENPRCCLMFYWDPLKRSVLSTRYAELEEEFKDPEKIIPKPDYWGGYRVIPDSFEFWQGQTNRLHDRIKFRKMKDGEILKKNITHEGEDGWVFERLSP